MIRAISLHRRGAALYGALTAALLLILMAVAQLFAYESFSSVLTQSLAMTSSSVQITLLAAFLVVFEVTAVANFVDVPLSLLARWFSRLCGLLVPVMWIAIMIAKRSGESAVLGAKLHLAVGAQSYGFMAALLMLAIAVIVFDIRRQA